MVGDRYLQTLLLVLLVLIAPVPAIAAGAEIPQASNLDEVGQMSRELDIPVVVFVSRDACPYCRTLRDKILKPMFVAGKFEDRAILVEISLDRAEAMIGFEGRSLTAKAFGEAYRAGITPTLLFLDAEGHEISKRVIGISNLELYGHYLQKSIDAALAVLHEQAK